MTGDRLAESGLLQTLRLQLRPLREDDRGEFIRVYEVSQALHDPWLPARTPGQSYDTLFTRTLEKARRGWEAGTEYRFLGWLDDGRIAGSFNLFHIERAAFECGTASWLINAEVARQGLATEGVRGMLDFAFAPSPHGLGLHRVQANIIPHNLASIRVAEKNDMRYEGIGLRYLRIAGHWQDHAFYAKLADEHVIRRNMV